MIPTIRFGTDGWRALVAEEFTFPNVRAVTQAVAQYLLAHPERGRPKKVIVGYDTRPLADRFAEAVAEVFAANGFHVLLTDSTLPTPAISFAIRELRLQGGIVVTASHNPFTYNGLKFKPAYAGPAEPEMTRWVEKVLFRRPVRRIPLGEGIASKRIERVDLAPRYLAFLRGYVNWPALKRANLRVAYESMQGAGQGFLARALEGSRIQVRPVSKAMWPIPSDHRPEPVGEHLKVLSSEVRRQRCHVGLATDGDADRIGLVGPDGRFISSQETMALLLWHLLEDRSWRGMVISTVSGTNLLEAITRDYHVELRRTPVGFKHIARLMRTENVLFGGEESGGFGFRGCAPERDGILGGLLILEMMAMRRSSLTGILRDMRRRFGHWLFERTDLTLLRPLLADRLLEWTRSPSARRSRLPGIGTVSRVQTLDGAKLIFEDKGWLLLRPSGTEPVLRIYAEARNRKALSTLIRWGRSIGGRIAR